MTAPLAEFKSVRHQYTDAGPTWHIPDLVLKAGQTVACVGPSGSGKTTLLELVAGMQTPRKGAVYFQGKDWSRLSPRARQVSRLASIGVVFQGFELFGALTAEENVALPLRLLGHKSAGSIDAANGWLGRAGIEHLARRKPAQLSHGERQRVAVCRALVHKPTLILADEPTANLDQESAERVFELLLHAAGEGGGALVCVTHDPKLVERLGQRWSSASFLQGAPA